jgi:2-polyprenyl-3-methyl-5-hydroxy-6-metoxy-1,4-benzoquinol methylase
VKHIIVCPLCKSAKTNLFCDFEKKGQQYLACSKCGLIYVSKIAPKNELYKSYNGGWFKALRRNLFARFRSFDSYGDFDDFMSKADKITTLVEKEISSKGTAGRSNKSARSSKSTNVRLLDIGCNKGFLLHSAIQKGWSVCGIELVPELLIPFRRKHKQTPHKLFTGSFDVAHKNFKRNYFDVITAIDVVEHFEDPKKSIKKIYDILRPGGLFVIQTPDSESAKAKKSGTKWGALKPLEHLFIFNKKNYGHIIKEVGFSETRFFKPFEESDGNFVAVSKK